MATRFLRVRNFDTHQHYKHRRPPWIKFHASSLDDYDISRLQDASKAHVFLIWLLASKLGNKIPYDAEWVGKQISATSPVDLDHLIQHGFLEFTDAAASTALAERKQDAPLETEVESESKTKPEKETEKALSAPGRSNGDQAELRQQFKVILEAYPKRAGGDSPRDGYLAFLERIRSGATAAEILGGVRRYALYCEATDKIGTEFVKQLRTFLGKSRHYLEPWDLPRAAGANSHSRRNAGEESYERGKRALQDINR